MLRKSDPAWFSQPALHVGRACLLHVEFGIQHGLFHRRMDILHTDAEYLTSHVFVLLHFTSRHPISGLNDPGLTTCIG